MSADSTTFDPAVQSEDVAFRPDALVSCAKCNRSNAPNRLECIYCGGPLPVQADTVEKVAFRELEDWEPGSSIVITGSGGDIAAAAQLLSLEPDHLGQIIASGVALPAARLEDKAAEIVQARLEALGLRARVITDTDLAIAKLPVRLTAMRWDNDGLTVTDFNTRDEHQHSWNDPVLIVTGSLAEGKIDSMEKRGLRRTTVTIETTTSADEPVFDVYLADDPIGYRVQLAGFDYSCLGNDMAPLAIENMSRLIDAIQARATDLTLVDDYRRIRSLLTGIWDIDSRRDPQGLTQVGFGKREFGVVHSTSNVEQFTKFSRLQRLML